MAPPLRLTDREEAQALIRRLREHIARCESTLHRFDGKAILRRDGPSRTPRNQPWRFGIADIDRHLPLEGLGTQALHDVSPERYGDFPAATGFALALAWRRLTHGSERRPMLWCRLESEQREYGRSYGHGLRKLGILRSRFLTVTLRRPAALFWTMEEALKSGALGAVLGDAASQHCDLTISRRLSLACAKGAATGIMVFTALHKEATSSQTRWRIETEKSQAPPFDAQAPGDPAWRVTLSKSRGGGQGSWTLAWQTSPSTDWHEDHAPHCFALVSGLSRGALHPGAAEGGSAGRATGPALRAG